MNRVSAGHSEFPQLLELRSENGAVAYVNPCGAYVESLAAPGGRQLVFPRRTMPNGKDRGGIPVCAPIFGPGDAVGLKQHGYARTMRWQRLAPRLADSADVVRLQLQNPADQQAAYGQAIPDIFARTVLDLMLRLQGTADGQTELHMALTVTNNGQADIPYAPGFHPYFPVAPGASAGDYVVRYSDGQTFQTPGEDLAVMQQRPSTSGAVQVAGPGLDVTMVSDVPICPAHWTDQPDSYFCVEPTISGYVDDGVAHVPPGESRTFAVALRYTLAG